MFPFHFSQFRKFKQISPKTSVFYLGFIAQVKYTDSSSFQELVKSLRDGEAKVKAAHALGEKTIPQTAPQGQSHIRRDLEALTQDFEALATRMGNTQENLIHALEALTAYDGSCDQLNKWLREMEATIKDVELKPTLGDKQGQVEKLKVNYIFVLPFNTLHPG